MSLWNTRSLECQLVLKCDPYSGFVGEVCLLVNSTLTTSQQNSCTTILSRTHAQFEQGINGWDTSQTNLGVVKDSRY